MKNKTLIQRMVYQVFNQSSRLIGVLFFRLRCFGRENWPQSGGGLVCANHQSFLDPVLVGLTTQHQMNFLARKSLMRFKPIGWFLQTFNAIPVDRDGNSLGGLKETLKRLKRDEFVLMFPEGTRTRNGEVLPLKSGFISLARRSKKPIIPVGFDGAYHSWPRTQLLPWPQPVHIVVEQPILPEEISVWDDEKLLQEIQHRIEKAVATARAKKESLTLRQVKPV